MRPWKTEIVWAHVVWFITLAWSNLIYYLDVLLNVQMNRPSETSQEKCTDKSLWQLAMWICSLVLDLLLMLPCPAVLQNLNFTSVKTEINKYKYRQYGQTGNAWGLAHEPAFLFSLHLNPPMMENLSFFFPLDVVRYSAWPPRWTQVVDKMTQKNLLKWLWSCLIEMTNTTAKSGHVKLNAARRHFKP